MSASDIASTISTLLQAQWSLGSPSAQQIQWTTTRVDSATLLQQTSFSYTIATYNPSSPTAVDVLSRECWQETERIHVDVFVKVSGTPATATQTREAMKNEVYRILHLNQLTISGVEEAYIERELNKVEGLDLIRITLQVACVNFHIQT